MIHEAEAAGSNSPPALRKAAVRRFFAGAAWMALAILHALLLIRQVADGSIVHPEILLRWSGAAALLTGVMLFRKLAPSRLRGARSLLVFWLLVLLLHFDGQVDHRRRGLEFDLSAVIPLTLMLPTALLGVLVMRAPARSLREGRLRRRLFDSCTLTPSRRCLATRSPPSVTVYALHAAR